MNLFSLKFNSKSVKPARERNIRRKTYLDRVDQHDASNRTFVMYHLSKYNNRHHFYYGETSDMMETEFRISKKTSAYKQFYAMPVEYSNMAFSSFEKYISDHKCVLPVIGCENWNVFSILDLDDIKEIINTTNIIYKAQMYQL